MKLYCKSDDIKSIEQKLIVKEQIYVDGHDRYYVNSTKTSELIFAAGEYYPFLINLDNAGTLTSELKFEGSRELQLKESNIKENDNPAVRDICINIELEKKDPVGKEQSVSRDSFDVNEQAIYNTGMNKIFRYPDPFDIYNVTEINTQLVYKAGNYLFWLDIDDIDNTAVESLTSFFNSAEIADKTEVFWGSPMDIDNDNSIFILLTSRINQTESILGFFNPLDCFTFNDDENSEAYNPCSNETDLIFTAIPDIENDSYCMSAIAATIAHELHHLIHFQRKTLRRLWSGDSNAPKEELFLDEGLSHLQESLCGLGESGGNLLFVKKWLSDTSAYSLGSCDIDGSIDSAGKRGAMAAFLWYLFQDQGGADWAEKPPADQGGISFLRNIVDSRKTGWDVLTELTGLSKQQLLKNYGTWINRMRIEKEKRPIITYDSVTGEPITISPYLGEFSFLNSSYFLEGPNITEYNIKTAPEAICFFNSFQINEKKTIIINQEENGIQSLWGFGMGSESP